jgi:ubiquinone/menaquinone biosynthesis C-methylase UbiE
VAQAAFAGNVDKWEAVAAELADLPPGSRVLECGPGTGLYTVAMLRRGLKVTAVDLSELAIEALRGAAAAAGVAEGLEAVHGEFTRVASGRSGFDAVTFFKTLHHFDGLAAIAAALRAGYSALGPGGRLVGLEPNGACPLWKPWLLSFGRHQVHVTGAASKWEHEKNLSLITRSSLGAIFDGLPGAAWQVRFHYAVPAALLRRLPALAGRIDAWLLATPWRARAFNLSFVVTRSG